MHLIFIFLKAIALFIAALYLLGFSFNGVNVIGKIDALIPFERLMCSCVSVALFVWFAYECYQLYVCKGLC